VGQVRRVRVNVVSFTEPNLFGGWAFLFWGGSNRCGVISTQAEEGMIKSSQPVEDKTSLIFTAHLLFNFGSIFSAEGDIVVW